MANLTEISFSDLMDKRYPQVHWNGQSDIHVSICRGIKDTFPADDLDAFITAIHTSEIAAELHPMLMAKFEHFEFIKYRHFMNLMIADASRHFQGLGDTKDAGKVKNPVTGNVVTVIAQDKDDETIVGCIRFWLNHSGGGRSIGWRFRITSVNPVDADNLRIVTEEESVEQAKEVYEMVGLDSSVVEIHEPPEEETVSELALVEEKAENSL